MISEYTTNDYSKILNVINDAASKYKGIIPDDCWHEPYMPKHELEDEFKNGKSHVRASIVGSPHVTIPIVDSELLLGRWQRIFFVELDRSRDRRFFVQIIK